jgi:hypothetical protein
MLPAVWLKVALARPECALVGCAVAGTRATLRRGSSISAFAIRWEGRCPAATGTTGLFSGRSGYAARAAARPLATACSAWRARALRELNAEADTAWWKRTSTSAPGSPSADQMCGSSVMSPYQA